MGRARVGKYKNITPLFIFGPAYTKLRARTVISEEGKHRSLVERRNHRIDLGAYLDAVHKTSGQLRSERRRAGLGT